MITANNIFARFIEEQEYVKKFIELLQRRVSFEIGNVYRITNTLEDYHLIDRKNVLKDSPFYFGSYDSDKIKELLTRLDELKPLIKTEISKTLGEINLLKQPKDIGRVDGRSLAGEWISFLIEAFQEDPPTQTIGSARILIKQNLNDYEEEPVFLADHKGTFDEFIDYCIDGALYMIPQRKVMALSDLLDEIEDVQITGRLSRSDTEINILRQGFITLTTIFDATVFDLIKVALNQDFFKLIALFGKQEKISLDKINKYSSFEEFKNEIIEDQLKSKYLKELLFILQGNGVVLTDTANGDDFIHLLEMILRRNIHIHNRGIIDNKYLETDSSGKARYNVYGLKPGTIARINIEYWERVNRLCLNCVKNITDWVNTLPIT